MFILYIKLITDKHLKFYRINFLNNCNENNKVVFIKNSVYLISLFLHCFLFIVSLQFCNFQESSRHFKNTMSTKYHLRSIFNLKINLRPQETFKIYFILLGKVITNLGKENIVNYFFFLYIKKNKYLAYNLL